MIFKKLSILIICVFMVSFNFNSEQSSDFAGCKKTMLEMLYNNLGDLITTNRFWVLMYLETQNKIEVYLIDYDVAIEILNNIYTKSIYKHIKVLSNDRSKINVVIDTNSVLSAIKKLIGDMKYKFSLYDYKKGYLSGINKTLKTKVINSIPMFNVRKIEELIFNLQKGNYVYRDCETGEFMIINNDKK